MILIIFRQNNSELSAREIAASSFPNQPLNKKYTDQKWFTKNLRLILKFNEKRLRIIFSQISHAGSQIVISSEPNLLGNLS